MKLFRGENILNGKSQRVSFLKQFMKHGLAADFINGGNPYRIQQLGLFDATVLHVAQNNLGAGSNGLKHFFSFSEEKSTAEGYAINYWDSNGNQLQNNYEIIDDCYTPDLSSYRDEKIWDDTQHLLIELDITGCQPVHPTSPFLKILSYNGGNNKLLALDVVSYLNVQIQRIGQPSQTLQQQFPNVLPQLNLALGYATTDTEWLITSVDPVPPQAGFGTSFSAIIPHNPILEIKHHVDPNFFTGI